MIEIVLTLPSFFFNDFTRVRVWVHNIVFGNFIKRKIVIKKKVSRQRAASGVTSYATDLGGSLIRNTYYITINLIVRDQPVEFSVNCNFKSLTFRSKVSDRLNFCCVRTSFTQYTLYIQISMNLINF